MDVVSQFLEMTPEIEKAFDGYQPMKVSVVYINPRKTFTGRYGITVKIEDDMGFGVAGMLATGYADRDDIAEKFSTGISIVRVYVDADGDLGFLH